MSNNKTVFILGAGFSVSAGAPSQAQIIDEIFNLPKSYKGEKKAIVSEWVKEFDIFLSDMLLVSQSEKKWYSLEDVFTPIDKSISNGTSFKSLTAQELIEKRNVFNKLIILAVKNAISKSNKELSYIEKFGHFLVGQSMAKLENIKNDSIAVITTNWDILLDNILYKIINLQPRHKGLDFSGVVDYCCNISSLDKDDKTVKPGLYALGLGAFNTKILKLHGSLNWLLCPNCQRLYVKFYQRWTGGYVFDDHFCRHCIENFKSFNTESFRLLTSLIMPTYVKDLDSIQHKLIWHNAAIELSEANKIVFLGYSLPLADFEFKQLLSRMIRADAEIEVVLVEQDNPNIGDKTMDYTKAGYRFQNFFSGRKLNIRYIGVENYIETLINNN
jgi:NAD-dependent SIR2 family protein deacetylase